MDYSEALNELWDFADANGYDKEGKRIKSIEEALTVLVPIKLLGLGKENASANNHTG